MFWVMRGVSSDMSSGKSECGSRWKEERKDMERLGQGLVTESLCVRADKQGQRTHTRGGSGHALGERARKEKAVLGNTVCNPLNKKKSRRKQVHGTDVRIYS